MPEQYDLQDDAHRLSALVVAALLESYVLADQTPLVESIIKDEFEVVAPTDGVNAVKEAVIAELSDLAFYLRNTYA